MRPAGPSSWRAQWNEQEKAGLRRTPAAAGLAEQELVFLGRVDDAELDWLYAAADLFVFPSLDEGLGLPPLEAARAGTAVVLAASSSLVELADHPAAFFPPGDDAALAARMTALLTDHALRAEVVASLQASAARFTWTATAERTWAALAGLPARTPTAPPRRSLLVVEPGAPLPEQVAAGLTAAYDVVRCPSPPPDAWRHERVLWWVEGGEGWDLDHDALAAVPGVLALPAVPPSALPDGALLAPLLGALVPAPEQARALLRSGLTGAPVHVVTDGDWAGPLEAVYAADVAHRWAGAGTSGAHLPAVHAPMARRSPAALRPRGRLLGSDTTIYRTTAFLSGIQRTAARLHDALDGRCSRRPAGPSCPCSSGRRPRASPTRSSSATPCCPPPRRRRATSTGCCAST